MITEAEVFWFLGTEVRNGQGGLQEHAHPASIHNSGKAAGESRGKGSRGRVAMVATHGAMP